MIHCELCVRKIKEEFMEARLKTGISVTMCGQCYHRLKLRGGQKYVQTSLGTFKREYVNQEVETPKKSTQSFKEWVLAIDKWCGRYAMVSLYDVEPDLIDYQDFWKDGVSPRIMAKKILTLSGWIK